MKQAKKNSLVILYAAYRMPSNTVHSSVKNVKWDFLEHGAISANTIPGTNKEWNPCLSLYPSNSKPQSGPSVNQSIHTSIHQSKRIYMQRQNVEIQGMPKNQNILGERYYVTFALWKFVSPVYDDVEWRHIAYYRIFIRYDTIRYDTIVCI